MYRKLPNLILGFHGCTKDVFDKVILHGEEMTPSTNDYNWLGHGVYFWEQNYERAKQWAEEMCKRRHLDSPPMVIGAVIDLGLCLNLSDSDSINLLFDSKNGLLEDLKNADVPAPVNSKYEHCLDCAVIQDLHDSRKEMGDSQFDSVRGFFSKVLSFPTIPASFTSRMCRYAFAIQTASKGIFVQGRYAANGHCRKFDFRPAIA